eukprot:NODE_3584_length_1196_cov_50.110904_g3403_i0.p1 GENE.NODE_3584_length_1196_cov_50.110904_g3403_i0~~NODE_3584_length_1196_cov_50.110904_g3403_i0.p1  ORF type:complete len:238 (-),score=29.64 NODE_3584_length_1196_cov_50.110904_g3403_i0:444-1157(-)
MSPVVRRTQSASPRTQRPQSRRTQSSSPRITMIPTPVRDITTTQPNLSAKSPVQHHSSQESDGNIFVSRRPRKLRKSITSAPAPRELGLALAFYDADCKPRCTSFTHSPYTYATVSASPSVGYTSDDSSSYAPSMPSPLPMNGMWTYPSSSSSASDLSSSPRLHFLCGGVAPAPEVAKVETEADNVHDGWTLCAGHRCEHKKSHIRLRGRKGMIFFVCSECSTTWRLSRVAQPDVSV